MRTKGNRRVQSVRCRKWWWVAVAVGVSVFLGIGICLWYQGPCRITMDCRGRRIDSEMLKQIRDQEKEGYLGVLAIAGWRQEPDAPISCPVTGRANMTKVLAVDGPMELIFPVEILSGTYGLATGDDFCVLTGSLAYELFGSTMAGEQILYDGRRLTVVGVINKEDNYLLVPTDNGVMESLAVRFRTRSGWRDNAEELLKKTFTS